MCRCGLSWTKAAAAGFSCRSSRTCCRCSRLISKPSSIQEIQAEDIRAVVLAHLGGNIQVDPLVVHIVGPAEQHDAVLVVLGDARERLAPALSRLRTECRHRSDAALDRRLDLARSCSGCPHSLSESRIARRDGPGAMIEPEGRGENEPFPVLGNERRDARDERQRLVPGAEEGGLVRLRARGRRCSWAPG